MRIVRANDTGGRFFLGARGRGGGSASRSPGGRESNTTQYNTKNSTTILSKRLARNTRVWSAAETAARTKKATKRRNPKNQREGMNQSDDSRLPPRLL
mmetsp:Transcript_22344/g.47116  ORF Transcript_22344/g.47116 Transcript_22344/m.47116 type:complete len:98 (+) Transcript_22344:830-1123(+)